MAPTVRRKKVSTTPPLLNHASSTEAPRLSPSKIPTSTPTRLRSPIRKSRTIGFTSPQKRIIIDNLMLEMNERVRRLRAQYEVQAQALRNRIEMRINRVPKRLWNTKMGDLLLKHARAPSSDIVTSIQAAPIDARALVEEVKRLSGGHEASGDRNETASERESKKSNTSETLVVAKKRVTKKVTSSNTCRTDLPPSSNPLSRTSSSSLSKASLGTEPAYPPPSPVKRSFSPLSQRKRSPLPHPQPPNTDPNTVEVHTPLTTKSSNVKPTPKVSRSNAVKSRALKPVSIVPPPVTQENERHYIKNTLSSGSLKENKVEGVVKKDMLDKVTIGKAGKASTGSDRSATGGRRVLRQRK